MYFSLPTEKEYPTNFIDKKKYSVFKSLGSLAYSFNFHKIKDARLK